MQASNPDEGMKGVSPRYVMTRLSSLVTQSHQGCVAPLAVLKALWAGLEEHIALASGDKGRYALLLQEAVKQYDLLALCEVQRASVEEFEEKSTRLFDLYWASVRAYCQDGGEATMDERVMRRLEERLGVTERARDRFRHEVFRNLSAIQAQGQSVEYATDPQLREGIERLLLPAPRALEHILSPAVGHKAEGEGEQRRAVVHQRLVQQYDYCDACASDLLDYVDFVFRGNHAIRITRAHRVSWHWEIR